MAFLIDDILLLPITGPIAGFRWVMKTIQKMALTLTMTAMSSVVWANDMSGVMS